MYGIFTYKTGSFMGQMLVNIPAPWSIRVGYLNDPKFMTSFWQNPCMILIGKMITNWGGFYFSKKEAGCKFACRPMCYKIGFSFWDTNIPAVGIYFFHQPMSESEYSTILYDPMLIGMISTSYIFKRPGALCWPEIATKQKLTCSLQ